MTFDFTVCINVFNAKKRLKNKDLADYLRVSEQYLSAVKRGSKPLPESWLESIPNYYGVSLYDFLMEGKIDESQKANS